MLSIVKFVLVIAAGCLLRRLGILGKESIPGLSRIMLYITLPCAMAAGTKGLNPHSSMLLLAVIGFAINGCMMVLGRFLSRDREEQILFMVNLSSLNIGSFSVPFAQAVLPASAIAYTGIYDLGNTWYGNGASYLIPKSLRDGENGFHITLILRRLCRSVPLISYLVFLILAYADIRLPDAVFQIIREVGSCNFLIVFLIAGIAMDLRVDRKGLKAVVKFIAAKYGIGVILSVLLYRFLPFDILVRRAAILCLLAPQSSASLAYCEMLECDSRVSSTMYTAGIVCTLMAYLVLSLMWKV